MQISRINSYSTPIIANKNTTKIARIDNNQIKADTVQFSGSNAKTEKVENTEGTFANQKFNVSCSTTLTKRTLKGAVGDTNFSICNNGKFLKSNTLTGNVNGKDINLTIKESIFSKKIVGDIGGEPVDLKASESWGGYNIKGKFKDKDINVKLDSKFVGYKLSSDNMSLRIKNKKLFGNDIKVEGTYNEDPELIPLLLDAVYNLQEEEMIMALVIA